MAAIDDLLALAVTHTKTDPADSAMLSVYLNSAIGICSNYARRNIYLDAPSLDADLATFNTLVSDAVTAWETAEATYVDSSSQLDSINYDAAYRDFVKAMKDAFRIRDGIVMDDAIRSAILITTGYFHKNRQDGDKPPVVARLILDPYMAV